jgi:uncharacterized protein (TIGR03435 family)
LATRLRCASLVVAAIAAALARGEAQTISIIEDVKLPRFEVASVKPGDPNSTWGSIGIPPGRFSQENMDLFSALMTAFNVRPYQVAMPLPDLITRERFTINAQAPAGTAPADRGLMVRALLIDRFKLRYHIDRGETDGYALTVARRDGRLGSSLRPSTVDCQSRLAARARKEDVPPLPDGAAECGVRNGPGSIDFGGMPIDALITMLSNQAGAPVVNHTGLSGNFDAKLRFALGSAGPPPPNAPPPSAAIDDAPSLFTAVQEQLGLKLTPAKAPLDRLVIDHIEPPDPD